MLLYADEFQSVKHNKELSIIEMDWTNATSRLLQNNYMRRIEDAVVMVERYRPQYVLANMEDMVYNGQADFNKWIKKVIYHKLCDSGVRKIAFVESHDTLTRLVVEDAINGIEANNVETKLFDTEEQAKLWFTNEIGVQ